MSRSVKLYGVAPSQPTRAVMFLCGIKRFPFEFIKMSPGAQNAAKQQFVQTIHPMGKIPAISVTDQSGKTFTLYESAAIMAYLCHLNEWNDLYPLDNVERRARIDEYLYWHQENTRMLSAGFIRPLMQSSRKKITDWDPYALAMHRKAALNALRHINQDRLARQKYIVDDALSIADIACYEEVIQLRFWAFILRDAGIEPQTEFPNLYEWMDRMKCLESHDETHRVMDKLTPWMQERYTEYRSLYDRVHRLTVGDK